MTHALPDEAAATPPSGAITYDLAEKYAVFVKQADADKFTNEQPDWRVDWCVETQPILIVQVV